MRTSLYLIGFASASLVGAVSLGFGCSSSSSPATTSPGNDASTSDSSSPVIEASTEAATDDGGGGSTEDVCVPEPGFPPVTTIDAAAFQCYEQMCGPSLTACSQSCICNNLLTETLLCQNGCMAEGGVPATCQAVCAAGLISATDDASIGVTTCLTPLSPANDGVCAQMGTTTTDAGDGGVADSGADAHD